ncbi:MAG: hypothetical protein JRH15_00570 [Deltaproteobacteria bacterium]|nr:hypothetical protein [Deltaproteobacteria bacterium]
MPVKSGTQFLYAHIEYSGGDGLTPPGLEIGSSPNLDVTITIRATDDPGSPVIDKFSGKWRAALRNSDGNVYDIVGLNFVEGVVNASYKTSRAAKRGSAICRLLESDLTAVSVGNVEYRFRIVGDTTFKVYEDV